MLHLIQGLIDLDLGYVFQQIACVGCECFISLNYNTCLKCYSN